MKKTINLNIEEYIFSNHLGDDFSNPKTLISSKGISVNPLTLYVNNPNMTSSLNINVYENHRRATKEIEKFIIDTKNNNKEPVVIILDAHIDAYDSDDLLTRIAANPINHNNIMIIGTRIFTDKTKEFLLHHPLIDVFKTNDVLALGVPGLVRFLTDKYSNENYEVYISLDLDVADGIYVPFVESPEPFGINLIDTMNICIGLINNLNVVGIDISEARVEKENNLLMNKVVSSLLNEFIVSYQIRNNN